MTIPTSGVDAAGALDASRGSMLANAQAEAGSKKATKIEGAARDFESILLGSWLQKAEASFGSVPEGAGDDDDDPGKEQYQGIAMQALGTSLADSGGIGIAKMIADHLRQAANATAAQPIAQGGNPDTVQLKSRKSP